MLTSGDAPRYGKDNLGLDSQNRWATIANRILFAGGAPNQAARVANGATREAIGRLLLKNRQNSYIPPT